MILAGIDIGTNTIRLLVADVGDSSYRELHAGRAITRLGEGLVRTGNLTTGAQERSLAVLSSFREVLRQYPKAALRVVGTSALRRAGNAMVFTERVRNETGLMIQVIDSAEEARLTMTGVLHALTAVPSAGGDPLRSSMLIDVGGGSTEIIVSENGAVRDKRSLDLGAVYLHERHVHTDPPSAAEVESLRRDIRCALDEWEQALVRDTEIRASSRERLIGTAGTITTLAAMDQQMETYDPVQINGAVLSATALAHLVTTLGSASLTERKRMTGLEPGREDIILAGALVCQEIMERCRKTELLVSDWGLREGIVFDHYERTRRR